MEGSLDFLSSVLDEVALEGLDGITLSSLWLRLQNRQYFPITIDENSKQFLWECIAVHAEVELYQLPEPRPSLVLFNRYEFVDTDLGIVIDPPEIPSDIYPMCVIDENGIKGSCATYNSRKCISSEVRQGHNLLVSLQNAVDTWGDKLVLVASQQARNISLMGSEINPMIEIYADTYCLLERIGRSRFNGEVTQGETGLLSLNTPFKKNLHYHRSVLTNKGLITKQLHYMKSKNGQTISGSLFHLNRFYVERQSRMQIMAKCMFELLKNKPNCQEEMKTLRSELGMKEASYKKLFSKPLQDCIQVSVVRFREMYPEAQEKEYLTANGQERIIKVVKLIRPYQEMEEFEGNKNESSLPPNIYFDPQNVVFNRPILQQVYKIVESSGYEGISAQDIGRKITLPKLEVRQLCNCLLRKNVVEEMVQDRGRQKVKIYICKQLVNKNLPYMIMEEQRKKILEMPLCPLIESDSNNRENSAVTNCETDKYQVTDYMQKNKDCDIINVKCGATNIAGSLPLTSVVNEPKNEKSSHVEKESSLSFTENLKAMHDTKLKNSALISDRLLKRAHIIIDALTKFRVMLVSELQNFIKKHEEKESRFTLDKKSLFRLLGKLAKDGLVKQGDTTLQLKPLKQLHYVCHPLTSDDDPRLRSIIEQRQFKSFGISKDSSEKQESVDTELKTTAKAKGNFSTIKLPKEGNINLARMECKPAIGKAYGLEPKFPRAKTLHTFLYYLLYNYEGTTANPNDVLCVYHKTETWKRFVPPLPCYVGYGEGWCLVADVILSMPLSIFVKLVNTQYKIEGLDEYLDDAEKQHYLLRHLPTQLKNSLLYGRRYIFSIHDIITRLCYMGLLSFGPQLHKEKDQIFIYVHQNASIKDTSISRAGYIYISEDIQYNVKNYNFQTIDDVEGYWVDLETICLHTPLGSYNTARGKSFSIVDINHKVPMIKAQLNKNVDDIVDKGDIPGDGLGAGGLDSGLYAHIKRNWSCPSTCNKMSKKKSKSKESQNEKVLEDTYIQYLLKGSTKGQHAERKRRLKRLTRNVTFVTDNHQTSHDSVELSKSERSNEVASKRRKIEIGKDKVQKLKVKNSIVKIRTIKRKNMWKKRRPYYDDKDKAALNKMSKMRVDWTAQEDSFLLLCKVASTFLDPNCRRLVVPFTVVRDFLYERFPGISDNKTSRACQRRVRYMLLNPTTSCNVAVFLGEAKQDLELVHEFDKPKPPKTQETEWISMFRSVLNRLLTKFTMSPSDRCKKVSLPEGLEEFYKSYEVKTTGLMFSRQCTHQDPRNYVDIRVGVGYALIISSLATIGDKTKWNFLLYKLYMQFPDSLLRSVVARLHNEQLITKKKNVPKKKVQNEPLSNLPYRFSCTYENGLHTRFPSSVFEEAHSLFKKLNAKYPPEGVELDGDMLPGYCAALLSLTAMHRIKFEMQIPDQIVLFDSSLSAEECSKIVERMRELQSLTDEASDELANFLKEGNTKHMITNESNANSHNPVSKKRTLDDSLKEYSKAEAAHFDHTNCNSDENYSHCSGSQTASNASVVDEEANVDNSKIHIEQSHASKASRFALYMLRQEFTQPPTERVHHSQDYFVINSCKIVCTLKDLAENKHSSHFSLSLNKDSDGHSKMNKDAFGSILKMNDLLLERSRITEIIKSQSQCISPRVLANSRHDIESVYCDHNSKTLEEGQAIFNYIHQKKDVGISHSELWKNFRWLYGDLSFQDHIAFLRKAMLIFRVGITCFRYVSVSFCKHWFLHSYIVPKEMKSYASEYVKQEQNMRKSESNLNVCFNKCDEEISSIDSCNQLNTGANKNAENKNVATQDNDTKLETPNEMVNELDNLGGMKITDHAGETLLNLVSSTEKNDQHLSTFMPSMISGTECSSLQDNQEENALGRTCRRKKHKGNSTELTCNRSENWGRFFFLARTWRKPDGALNRPILMKLLKSVLSYLFTEPGATNNHICEHYSLVLQPIQTLELLEMLEIAQCIKKYYSRCSTVPTLFSKPKSISYITDNPEPGDSIHYEPTVDAILKIGQLSDSVIIRH